LFSLAKMPQNSEQQQLHGHVPFQHTQLGVYLVGVCALLYVSVESAQVRVCVRVRRQTVAAARVRARVRACTRVAH
jgi:hypothetical protein